MRMHGIAVLAALTLVASSAAAQSVPLDFRFTYSGELRLANVVVDQPSDFQFSLFDQPTGGNQTGTTNNLNAVPVARGVFTVDLDFGNVAFAGDRRHLEIAVRSPAGAGVFTTLSPRVELTPAPNAHYARFAGIAFNAFELDGLDSADFVQQGEANSVTTLMVTPGAIGTAQLADAAVTTAKIADGAVSNSKLSTWAVTENKIFPNAVTSLSIKDGQVNGFDLADGAVDSSKLGANAVTSNKIANGAITGADLASNSVSSAKIVDGTITSADLAAGAVDGGDAATLGGLGVGNFLRSDASDSFSGPTLKVAGVSTLDVDGTLRLDGFTKVKDGGSIEVEGAPASFSISGTGLDLELDAAYTSMFGNAYVQDDFEVDGNVDIDGSVELGGDLRLGKAEGDHSIHFYENGSPTGEAIEWRDAAGRFFLTQSTWVEGSISTDSGLILNRSGLDTDSVIFFYANGTPLTEKLEWEGANDRFEFSDDLYASGELELGDDLHVGGDQLYLGKAGADGDSVINFYEGGSASGEKVLWDDSQQRFEMTNDLAVAGTIDVGQALGGGDVSGTAVSYNRIGVTATPGTGDIANANDLLVGSDLEVGQTLYLNGQLRMNDAEEDQSIYFYDSGSPTNEFLRWSDADDRFRVSDDFSANGSVSADTDIYVNRNGPDGDSSVFFYEGGSATGESLTFDDSSGNFDLSGGLVVEGGSLSVPDAGFPGTINGSRYYIDNALGDHGLHFLDNPASIASNWIRNQSWGTSCTLYGASGMPLEFGTDSVNGGGWIFTSGSPVVVIDTDGDVLANGVVTGAAGCDLAENFLSQDEIAARMLVAADPVLPEGVVASRRAYDPALVGVVSIQPSLLMGGPTADSYPVREEYLRIEQMAKRDPENVELRERCNELMTALHTWPRGDVPVALAGRVLVNAIGPVQSGEPLTSSDVEGHAMAMRRPGPSVGIALESKTSAGRGEVLVLVQPGWREPTIVEDEEREDVASTDDRLDEHDARFAALEELVRAERSAGRGRPDGRNGLVVGERSDGDDGRDGARDVSGDAPIVRIRKEAWGDFDADGRDDVLVLNPAGASRLYRNLGDGTFQDVTVSAGLGDLTGIRMAIFEDTDADRRLDLMLVNDAGQASLFQGRGNGAFVDVTEALGLDFGEPIVDAEWIDHDRDGKPDLRVELADGTLLLHHNLGQGTFKAITLRAAIAGAAFDAAQTEMAEMRAQIEALTQLVEQLAAGREGGE